jgi:tripeptide aminopeptidase
MSAEANRRIAALASQRAVHAAFGWLHLHEPQVRRWQREIIEIGAPTFAEGERATWMAENFRALGLTGVHIDDAGNALAEVGPSAGPVVLVSAHLDTVFPAGTDCRVRERDGVLHAPGATDNAAGLAGLLALAAAVKHSGIATPGTRLVFAANVGEEGEGDLRGMRHLFGGSPLAGEIRAAIALEGAGTGTVIDRALGSRRLRVSVDGPGGHSWADAGRPNAIVMLAEALVAVSRLALPTSPRTTLNVGTITGGNSVNSIAATASADLDLRSASGMELERLELAVLRTIGGALRPYAGTTFGVGRIGDRPAGALDADSALAKSLRAVDRHLGIVTDSRLGSTDANLPLSLGIPALAIGAGGAGGGIHTLGEWFDPAGRELALRRVLLLVLDASG